MNSVRRTLLGRAGAAGALATLFAAGLLRPVQALAAAWNKDAFQAKTITDALGKVGAARTVESKDIIIDAPEIAENGAVVPIEVTSNVAGTRAISVFVEKNPFPLAAHFEFKDGAVPYVKLNIKIGESSRVRVVADAGGTHHTASKEVKVTIGGCGG